VVVGRFFERTGRRRETGRNVDLGGEARRWIKAVRCARPPNKALLPTTTPRRWRNALFDVIPRRSVPSWPEGRAVFRLFEGSHVPHRPAGGRCRRTATSRSACTAVPSRAGCVRRGFFAGTRHMTATGPDGPNPPRESGDRDTPQDQQSKNCTTSLAGDCAPEGGRDAKWLATLTSGARPKTRPPGARPRIRKGVYKPPGRRLECANHLCTDSLERMAFIHAHPLFFLQDRLTNRWFSAVVAEIAASREHGG